MLLNDTGKKNFCDGEVAPNDANKVTWDLWDFVGFEGFSLGMVGFMWDFRVIPKCSFFVYLSHAKLIYLLFSTFHFSFLIFDFFGFCGICGIFGICGDFHEIPRDSPFGICN